MSSRICKTCNVYKCKTNSDYCGYHQSAVSQRKAQHKTFNNKRKRRTFENSNNNDGGSAAPNRKISANDVKISANDVKISADDVKISADNLKISADDVDATKRKNSAKSIDNIPLSCGICDDDISNIMCLNEGIAHVYCKSCILQYLKHTLRGEDNIKIVYHQRIECPDFDCSSFLPHKELSKFLDKKTLNKMVDDDEMVARLIANNNENVTNNDLESFKSLSKNTQPCPNCKTLIQRKNGCRHMTCILCHTHFYMGCTCEYNKCKCGIGLFGKVTSDAIQKTTDATLYGSKS